MDRQGYAPTQVIALVLGGLFALAGVAGFFVTGFDDFAAGDTGEHLLGLEVNPLHNLVHLLFGLPGLLVWRRFEAAKGYLWLVAVSYAAVLVYGLVVVDDPDANVLSVNASDNGFHAFVVILAVTGAVWSGRDRYAAADRRGSPATRR